MVKVLLWLLLAVVCWPLAIVVLVLYPVLWLLALPFRIAGWAIGGSLLLVKELLFLPARCVAGRSERIA